MFQRLRELIRDVWTETMEPVEKKTAPTVHVDCPVHGRTFLHLTRQTACCASRQFVPSGKVKSRALTPSRIQSTIDT
jgi:hypothetical protein